MDDIFQVALQVKLCCIDRTIPEVVVISFHTPQFPMRTKAGTVKPPWRALLARPQLIEFLQPALRILCEQREHADNLRTRVAAS